MAGIAANLVDPQKINIDGFPGTFTIGTPANPRLVAIQYGGNPGEGQPGHGEIISHNGTHVHRWKRPACQGGKVEIDNEFSTMLLSSFGF